MNVEQGQCDCKEVELLYYKLLDMLSSQDTQMRTHTHTHIDLAGHRVMRSSAYELHGTD